MNTCKGSIIINQSQQRGIETLFTRYIADELYSYTIKQNKLCAYFVKCVRPENLTGTDTTTLFNSIDSVKDYYNQALKYHLPDEIRQVDIHCNSYNGKESGLLLLWISQPGHTLATNIISEFRKVYPTHIEGLRRRLDLYTLKHSPAVNVVIECGYYDNMNDFTWFYEHTQSLVKAIHDGVLKSITS